MFDDFDQRILRTLQRRGNATNAELAEAIGISTSQAGRRKARLEVEGVIEAYEARLDPQKLGLGIQAFVQISLSTHSQETAKALHEYLVAQDEIVNIWTMTGSADYLLQVFCHDLGALNDLVHGKLLAHDRIARVESQIVMNQLKRRGALPVG